MPKLSIDVVEARPITHAASPQLGIHLRLGNAPADMAIEGILLHCQLQIEATRRGYDASEQARLFDLFGEPQRWGTTLRTIAWCQPNTMVPAFTTTTDVVLPVPCSYDMEVAVGKYLFGIEGGDVPLLFLWSGTVFYRGVNGLQTAPVGHDCESRHAMPVGVWRDTMEHYFPNRAWLPLDRDVFEALRRYRSASGATSWERAVSALLEAAAPTDALLSAIGSEQAG